MKFLFHEKIYLGHYSTQPRMHCIPFLILTEICTIHPKTHQASVQIQIRQLLNQFLRSLCSKVVDT